MPLVAVITPDAIKLSKYSRYLLAPTANDEPRTQALDLLAIFWLQIGPGYFSFAPF